MVHSNVTVTWLHDGVALDTEAEEGARLVAEVAEDAAWASLTLLDTSRQDAGLYSCTAENEVGSGASEVFTSLDVFCKFYREPINNRTQLQMFADPPSVYAVVDPAVVSEAAGYPAAVLRCELGAGHPGLLTEVAWFRDGEQLTSFPFVTCDGDADVADYELRDADMELFSDATDAAAEEEDAAGDGSCAGAAVVTLELVTRHDAGLYTCRGTNEAGPGPLSSPASLRVQCESE